MTAWLLMIGVGAMAQEYKVFDVIEQPVIVMGRGTSRPPPSKRRRDSRWTGPLEDQPSSAPSSTSGRHRQRDVPRRDHGITRRAWSSASSSRSRQSSMPRS